mgnify:CR=1 FL=1
MSDIIYTFKNNAYFNITNRCTCKCIFCIRNEHEAIGEATELWHDHPMPIGMTVPPPNRVVFTCCFVFLVAICLVSSFP